MKKQSEKRKFTIWDAWPEILLFCTVIGLVLVEGFGAYAANYPAGF